MLLSRELPKIANRKCNERTGLYLQALRRTGPLSTDLVEDTSQDSQNHRNISLEETCKIIESNVHPNANSFLVQYIEGIKLLPFNSRQPYSIHGRHDVLDPSSSSPSRDLKTKLLSPNKHALAA